MSSQSHPNASGTKKWLRPIAILIGLLIGAAWVGLPNNEWFSVTRIIPGFLIWMGIAFGMLTNPEGVTRAMVLYITAPALLAATIYIGVVETPIEAIATGIGSLALLILQYAFATIANGEPKPSNHPPESSLNSHPT